MSLHRFHIVLLSVALAWLAACQPQTPPAPPVPTTELLAVDTPPPAYPEELACDNVGGQVVLLMTVGPDGRPGAAEVFRSSGIPALDKAAQEGVRQWQRRGLALPSPASNTPNSPRGDSTAE